MKKVYDVLISDSFGWFIIATFVLYVAVVGFRHYWIGLIVKGPTVYIEEVEPEPVYFDFSVVNYKDAFKN